MWMWYLRIQDIFLDLPAFYAENPTSGTAWFYAGIYGWYRRPDRYSARSTQCLRFSDLRIHLWRRLRRTARKKNIFKVIQQTCVTQKGKLIIPAFSVGAQEIVLCWINWFKENRLPNIPGICGFTAGGKCNAHFEIHPECFDKEILNYMTTDPNPFGLKTEIYAFGRWIEGDQ